MRIIDDKGRLFGLVNVLDLIIIIFVLFVAFGVVSHHMLIAKAPKSGSAKSTKGEELLLKVIYYAQPNDIIQNKDILHPGDTDIMGTATLEKIEVRPIDEKRSDIIVTIKARCHMLDGQYYYSNMSIKVGLPFTFLASQYALRGEGADGSINVRIVNIARVE